MTTPIPEPGWWIARDDTVRVAFVYHGGAYIDIYWSDALAIRGLVDDDRAVPFSNIGVWDYEAGESTVKTQEKFRQVCREWIDANRGDLGGYLEQSI